MRKTHYSCSCGGAVRHSAVFDSFYCTRCFVWLEKKCSDVACEFCTKRPEKAPEDV